MGLFGKTERIELQIDGMTCGNCVQHVSKALASVAGVRKTEVDLEQGIAVVHCKGDASRDAMVAAVVDAGYQAH